MDAVYSIVDQFLQQGNAQQAWNLLQSVSDKTTPEYMQRVQQCQQMMAPPQQPQYQQPQPQYQQPMGQPQYQQPMQPQYQQSYQQQPYQQQYQQPGYQQQPFGGPMGYAPRPAINLWESIAKWDFKVMTFIAVGAFFLSIFVSGLTSDRTVNGLFSFLSIASIVLVSFIIYAQAAPKMAEGNGIGWSLLIGGILVVLFQFVLTFITSWDTYKTLNIIKFICTAAIAFPLLYAFFKVTVFEHSLPALIIGVACVLTLLGGLIGGNERFGALCQQLATFGWVSSVIILLGEVIYNRSLNRG